MTEFAETVYVSQDGNDANPGSSPQRPAKTIAEAMKRAEPGRTTPLCISLERGHWFNGQAFGSVRCASLMVVSHGPAGRAHVIPPLGEPAISRYGGGGTPKNVALSFRGVSVYAPPDRNGKETDAGILFLGGGVLDLGDVMLARFATNVVAQSDGGDLTVLGAPTLMDAFCSSAHSHGMYIEDANLFLTGGMIARNGYNNALGIPATKFNQGLYAKPEPGGVPKMTVVQNVRFELNAATGAQFRGGGASINCIYHRNPIAATFGLDDSPVPGGVIARVMGGEVIQGGGIDGSPRGIGLHFGNCQDALVAETQFRPSVGSDTGPAIYVDHTDPNIGVGVLRMTLDRLRPLKGWRGPHVEIDETTALAVRGMPRARMNLGPTVQVEKF